MGHTNMDFCCRRVRNNKRRGPSRARFMHGLENWRFNVWGCQETQAPTGSFINALGRVQRDINKNRAEEVVVYMPYNWSPSEDQDNDPSVIAVKRLLWSLGQIGSGHCRGCRSRSLRSYQVCGLASSILSAICYHCSRSCRGRL